MICKIHRVTQAEVRDQVDAAILDSAEWSDRRLAVALGVSREMVSLRRRKLERTGRIAPRNSIVGRDGKVYDPAKIRGSRIRTWRFTNIVKRLLIASQHVDSASYHAATVGDRVVFHQALRRLSEITKNSEVGR